MIMLTASTPLSNAKPSTSSSYRLLYRGALCLPDSYLTLDGITFCAQIGTPSKRTPNGNHDHSLLENPLALALETMRGRPTLRFMGTVKLSDTWMDDSGDVLMDIHPNAMLTRIYFENTFCLGMYAEQVMENVLGPPIGKGKGKEVDLPQASDLGIKVALGDTDGPETTYMVIFARLNKTDSSDANGNQRGTVQLVVARLTRPPNPHPRPRLPRPDDPIPRKPPLLLLKSKGKRSGPHLIKSAGTTNDLGSTHTTRELKRVASAGSALASNPKRPKLVAHEQSGRTNGHFRIPEVPLKATNAKGRGKAQIMDADVFGLMVVNRHDGHIFDEDNVNEETERANKNVIKKAALDILARTKDPGSGAWVNRSHPDFKEVFQWVYRGVSFALRARMKSAAVELGTVQHLVKCHVEMYVGGGGSLRVSADLAETQKCCAAHPEP